MDQQRGAQVGQDPRRLGRPLGRIRRDAGIQRPPRLHRRVQRTHRLLERRGGIGPVRVEDVDIVDVHPPQRLIERGEHVLARSPLTVRPGPHVVARLGRDDQLVTVPGEVGRQDRAEILLGRSVRRAVVVGQVDVRDAEVERPSQDLPLAIERHVMAEVLPQAERHRRQAQTAATTATVRMVLVTIGGEVRHHATMTDRQSGGRRPRSTMDLRGRSWVRSPG